MNLLKKVEAILPKSKVAVAVSGGVDSIALMHVLSSSKLISNKNILILTVDHGLREGSKKDIHLVVDSSKKLGLRSQALKWKGSKPKNRIQEIARDKRYELLTNVCKQEGIKNLFLAHHLDDQIETFFMRLSKGSGLHGLTSFKAITTRDGIKLHRPFIDTPKKDLLRYAKVKNLNWSDDPSNYDDRFTRSRLRKVLPILYQEGFNQEQILISLKKMKIVDDAIEDVTEEYMRKYLKIYNNIAIFLSEELFFTAPKEIQIRVIEKSIKVFSSSSYSPRRQKIENLIGWIQSNSQDSAKTLGGTIFRKRKKELLLYKEPKLLDASVPIKPSLNKYKKWDSRFLVKINKPCEGMVRELGKDGIKFLKTKKIVGKNGYDNVPISAFYSAPSFWNKKGLISAPFLGYLIKGQTVLYIRNIDLLH
tara:strand:+ start:2628 stop:3887 length:1260 start_codon:yes stop_codon:yes gene_type:complete